MSGLADAIIVTWFAWPVVVVIGYLARGAIGSVMIHVERALLRAAGVSHD